MRSAHDREPPSAREIFAAAAAEAPGGRDGRASRWTMRAPAAPGAPTRRRRPRGRRRTSPWTWRRSCGKRRRARSRSSRSRICARRVAEEHSRPLWGERDADEGDDAADDAADGGGGGRKRSAEDADDDYGMERLTTSSRATARSSLCRSGSDGGGPNVEHARGAGIDGRRGGSRPPSRGRRAAAAARRAAALVGAVAPARRPRGARRECALDLRGGHQPSTGSRLRRGG